MSELSVRRTSCLLLASFLLASWSVHAQGTTDEVRTLELRAGYGHSDNALRVDTDEVDSDILAYGLRVDWVVDRPVYSLNIVGDVDRLDYSEDQVNDRYSGDLDARIDVKLVDERIIWWVADTFTQLREDFALGDTPENLREVNVLGTGIDANLALGARTSLGVQVGFSDRQFDDSAELDNDEKSASIALVRRTSPRSQVGLVAGRTEVSYDETGGADYDIDRGLLNYQSELATGSVSIGVGANRITGYAGDEDNSWRPLVDISWTREIATRSQLSISARHRFDDLGSAIGLGEEPTLGSSRPGTLVGTQSPFEETDISVNLETAGNTNTFAVGLSYTEQDFADDVTADNDVIGLGLSWRRDLSELMTFGVDAFAGRQTDKATDFQGDDNRIAVFMTRSIGERLSVAFRIQQSNRNADNDSDYDEFLARIDFSLLLAQ